MFRVLFIAASTMLFAGCTTKNDLSLIFSDENNPQAVVVLHDGSGFTKDSSVPVKLSSGNPKSMVLSEMSVSVGSTCADIWEPYQATSNVNLPNFEGTYSVAVRLRNEDGFVSPCTVSEITIDKTPPVTGGSMALSTARSKLTETPTLLPSTYTDSLSGIAKYEIKLVKTAGTVTIQDWTEKPLDALFFSGLNLPDVETDTYFYVIRVTDKVGNVSAETTSGTFIVGPILSISTAVPAVDVANAMGYVTVSLSRAAAVNVTVSLQAISGTAIAGLDFLYPDITPEVVTIPAGTTQKNSYYSVLGTSLPGPEKAFSIKIINNTNSVATDASQNLRITNLVNPALSTVPASGFKAINGEQGHMCAVTTDDKLQCWGGTAFDNGQSVAGDLHPRAVAGATNVLQLTTGNSLHTCYLDSAKDLYCFGSNFAGELGSNDQTSRATPFKHPTLSNLKKVSTGRSFTCVIDSADKVYCWGLNTNAEIGRAISTPAYFTPQLNTDIVKAIDLSSGLKTSCAIDEVSPGTRVVKCWGAFNDIVPSPSAITITGLPNDLKSLSANSSNASDTIQYGCALTDSNKIFCWGDNHYSRRGTTAPTVPTVANEVTYVAGEIPVKVLAGTNHACALSDLGNLYCWGSSVHSIGQTDRTLNTEALTRVNHVDGEFMDFTLTRYTSCGVTKDTRIKCWGINVAGESGNGRATGGYANVAFPADRTNRKYTQVVAGLASTCALGEDKNVYCWGFGGSGRLGLGDIHNRVAPTRIISLSNVKKITALERSYCALTEAGSVACWGNNDEGQIADPNAFESSLTPFVSTDPDLQAVVDIASGRNHSCALLGTGTVKCWGFNDKYQSGGVSTAVIHPSAFVSGLSNIESIAAGDSNTCAVRSSGGTKTILCWGSQDYGILGTGTMVSTGTPQVIDAITTTSPVSVYVSEFTACYIHQSVTKCWGTRAANKAMPLSSVPDNTPVPLPTVIPELAGASTMDLGYQTGCATMAEGGVKCWGVDFSGLVLPNFGVISAPTAAPGGTTSLATAVGVGKVYTETVAITACAVASIGDLRCWGIGFYMQGNGEFFVATPTYVMQSP